MEELGTPVRWHLVNFPACGHRPWVPSATVAEHLQDPMTCPACDTVSSTWQAWSESWLREHGGLCRRCGVRITFDQASGHWMSAVRSTDCSDDKGRFSLHRPEDPA